MGSLKHSSYLAFFGGLFLFGLGSTAQAFDPWSWGGNSCYSPYSPFYPGSIYPQFGLDYCCPTYPYAYPRAAQPYPAPPSGLPQQITPATPYPQSKNPNPKIQAVPREPPKIFESRSMAGGSAVWPPGLAKEKCKVGFWNLTGQDVVLKIDGQPYNLGKDRAMSLDLDRNFTWEINSKNPRTVMVPPDQPTHEVVLR